MVLRWLAGGSVRDMMMLFGVSKEAAYHAIWLVFKALVAAHPIMYSMQQDFLRPLWRASGSASKLLC